MDRSTKQKINKETQTLNDAIDQLDLIDIYMTFHAKTMNFSFFSSAHGTFSRIDHILGHKSNLEKRDTYRLKVKGRKKIFHTNRDLKKAGVAILISDKIDFKTKAVKEIKKATT